MIPTARIERALFYRARSASKEGTLSLPPIPLRPRVARARGPFQPPRQSFSILLKLGEVGGAQWLVRNHLVKRHLHAPLSLPVFQQDLKRPQQAPVSDRAEILVLNGCFHRTGFRETILPNNMQCLPLEPQLPAHKLGPVGRTTVDLQPVAILFFHEDGSLVLRNRANPQHTTHRPHTQLKQPSELS